MQVLALERVGAFGTSEFHTFLTPGLPEDQQNTEVHVQCTYIDIYIYISSICADIHV